MMNRVLVNGVFILAFALTGCVSKQAFLAEQQNSKSLEKTIAKQRKDLRALKNEVAKLKDSIAAIYAKYPSLFDTKGEVVLNDKPTRSVSPSNKPLSKDTNSGKNIAWMSDNEKATLYYLNMARMDPKGFCKKYITPKLKLDPDNTYISSCIVYMNSIEPLGALVPEKKLFESAKCHASTTGKIGYVGHERKDKNCKSYFWGECISYGVSSGLNIVIQLLVDDGVPSLGHRYICLGTYTEIGISQENHTAYGVNTVLDFR